MIQATYAPNFVTVFGLIYSLQLVELKSTFFLSEQVIDLKHRRTNNSKCILDGYVSGARIHAKANQHCQSEDCFIDDME